MHADSLLWELQICTSRGMHDLAVKALTRAVATDSAQPTGHNEFGSARDDKQYRGAVSLPACHSPQADYPEAHSSHGPSGSNWDGIALNSCQRASRCDPATPGP